MPFPCPVCGADSRVLDTRMEMRRRRCTEDKSHIFFTQEIEYEWKERKAFNTIRRDDYEYKS